MRSIPASIGNTPVQFQHISNKHSLPASLPFDQTAEMPWELLTWLLAFILQASVKWQAAAIRQALILPPPPA